jgi:hypothetical protein
MVVPSETLWGDTEIVGTVTVNDLLALLPLVSVTTIVCDPVARLVTVNDAEKEPLVSVVTVLGEVG